MEKEKPSGQDKYQCKVQINHMTNKTPASQDNKKRKCISDDPKQCKPVYMYPRNLHNLITLPSSRLHNVRSLAGAWPARVLVLGHVRVRVGLLVQVAQGVVDLTVLGLVRAHVQQQVAHRPLALGHLPVLDSDLRSGHVLPLGQLAGLEVVDGTGVGDDGLLLEVGHEAVAGAGRDQVREEEAIEEDALRAQDHQAHEPARFGELHEGKEVHAFVVGFFEEGFDPAVFWVPRSARVPK